MMKYFTYCPLHGLTLHYSQAAAEQDAEHRIQDCLNDRWGIDTIKKICWGEVRGIAQTSDEKRYIIASPIN